MTSAIADLKTHGLDLETISTSFASFLADKGYHDLVHRLSSEPYADQVFAQAFGQFCLRLPLAETTSLLLRQAIAAGMAGESSLTYFGSERENREINERFMSRGRSFDEEPFADPDDRANLRASRFFSLHGFRLPSGILGRIVWTPIVIVGAGAAGILAARICVDAGFRSVRVLDTTGEYGGIWRHKNVRGGSRNNPIPFGYDRFRVEAAPGNGETITQFLEQLVSPPSYLNYRALPAVERVKVLRVEPGDLRHRIHCDIGGHDEVIETPLLVAALGQGKPLPPSRPEVMTTKAPYDRAGMRWQQQLTPDQARALVGKTVVFIGLGNSTAEMLVQIQRYRDAGFDIKYKVLTHYPRLAVRFPSSSEYQNDREYRLYRDVSVPNFKHLAGDLEHIRDAFERVRESADRDAEELLSDVTHWDWEGESANLVVTMNNGTQRTIRCDQLYTLIGYGHSAKTLQALGMTVIDEYAGAVAHDYDGEMQQTPLVGGRERLYPGYFGLGAVLKSAYNKGNEQVIPDMMFRLPDLLFSLFLRAAEWALS